MEGGMRPGYVHDVELIRGSTTRNSRAERVTRLQLLGDSIA